MSRRLVDTPAPQVADDTVVTAAARRVTNVLGGLGGGVGTLLVVAAIWGWCGRRERACLTCVALCTQLATVMACPEVFPLLCVSR